MLPSPSDDRRFLVRRLVPGEESLTDAFLARHAASSLFLRSNLQKSGLVDGTERYHGTWVGVFAKDLLIAVACHAWNGNILLQAPEAAATLVEATLAHSARTLIGLVGPWEQIEAARCALAADRSLRLHRSEILFSLPLEKLVIPDLLSSRSAICRKAVAADLPQLLDWRMAFLAEALNQPDTPNAREEERLSLEHSIEDRGGIFVLDVNGTIVAVSNFSAAISKMVQIGGVWTPPHLRRRGYARSVVAGSLLIARAEGVEEAVLFTDEQNISAQHAYAALGFTRIGEYGMIFFEGEFERPEEGRL
ncbi:MAG TPA: GNAT family N-acetyltransferase [Candidatus Baltobacteraceae bacterium]|jgi:RimJ/RimL family protein N-acetyltransferase|nr:GNAT family N-acetyltransferase [Candidatus Baltobacteraceae bacterium]